MARRYTVHTIVPLGDGKIVLREADAKAGEGDDDRQDDGRQEAPRSEGRDSGHRDDH